MSRRSRCRTISEVYVHDNSFTNQSQFFLAPSFGMPVVDLGGTPGGFSPSCPAQSVP